MSQKNEIQKFKDRLVTEITPVKSRHSAEFLWSFDLKVKPEQIWPFISDTSRMNRELGLPPWKEKTVDGELHVEITTLGKLQHWIEKVWVWQEPKELQNHRVYITGWMTEQRGAFATVSTPEGCRVDVYFEWGFPSIFTKLFFGNVVGVLKPKFERYFKNKENLILSNTAESQPVLSPEINTKKSEVEKDLDARSLWNDPMDRLITYFLTEDDMVLDRIQLKKIAQKLDIPLPKLMDMAHTLMVSDYMTLAWDVICPHCRGTASSEPAISKLGNPNYCDACEFEFDIDQEESVEIVFKLSKKIREINKMEYCAAEPAKKKHIKLYQLVPKGQTRKFSLSLQPGRYRIRGGQEKNNLTFDVVSGEGDGQLTWPQSLAEGLKTGTELLIDLTNHEGEDLYVAVEESWWHNDRLFPGEVLTQKKFRQFLSNDHLGLGVKLALGNQVLLFTDIVGSTPLYRDLGDARAFGAVNEHYQKVAKIIADTNGALIKYIGDAVMAAYVDLDSAFDAAIRIQQEFSTEHKSPIKLRISLNYGPVLCANMNVGLDYFGTTVNTAAKIQKWAGAHQIAVPDTIWTRLKPQFASRIKSVDEHQDDKLGMKVAVLNPHPIFPV